MALLTKSLLVLFLAAVPAWAGSLDVGDRLEHLALVDRNGAAISPQEIAGKVVILDFWASWCGPCRPTLGALEGIARRYGDAGVVVLGVNADEDRDDAEEFLNENFPRSAIRFVYDPGRRLLSSIGADGLPALYVLDSDRVVRMAETGFSPREMAEVENEVGRLVGKRERQHLDVGDLVAR